MGILENIKSVFVKKKEEPIIIPKEPESPKVPADVPLSERFDPAFQGKRLKYFWSLDQKLNKTEWASEIGTKDEKVPWNSCMTASYADFLLSVINMCSVVFWKNKMEYVMLRDILKKENIEEWYYKELMTYFNQTPEPDHRWQASAHAKFLNQMFAQNGRSDLIIKTGTASIEGLKKAIDSGFPYIAGTWETAFGHIICFCGYDEKGAWAGNSYGQWGRKLGYYASGGVQIQYYTWAEIEYMIGLKLNGFERPVGWGRTWCASF